MPSDSELTAEELKAAKKAAKKEKKRLEKAQAEAEAEAASKDNEKPVEETEEERKRRKAEKKEKKRLKKEAEQSVDQIENDVPAPAAALSSASESGIQKNFYTPHPSVAAMSSSTVSDYRAKERIQISEPGFNPILEFGHSTFTTKFLECTKGFAAPTPIQAQCWPVLLSGRDVIAIAETGSGKTLGFVLPALVHITSQLKTNPILSLAEAQSKGKFQSGGAGPITLIVSPTRELAIQTAEVCEKAGSPAGIRTATIYGGISKEIQKQELKRGVHIIVATPGRLLGLMEERLINLSRVTFCVLDEADRMLDMGFEPDIRAIMKAISPDRQTLMFSATWPEVIQKLAHEFIRKPVHITIGKENAADLKANTRVTQTVEVIEDRARDGRLLELLKEFHASRKNRILIFVLYKKEVERVERFLQQKGWNVVGISGDKSQGDRTQAIESFKRGDIPLLVATDVAARGIDIKDVTHVINYSFPLTVEDYIHRIGRTGRGGQTGISYTFFTRNDKHLSGELINVLNEAKEKVPADLLKFGTGVKRKEHAMYGAHFKPSADGEPMKKAVKVTFD